MEQMIRLSRLVAIFIVGCAFIDATHAAAIVAEPQQNYVPTAGAHDQS